MSEPTTIAAQVVSLSDRVDALNRRVIALEENMKTIAEALVRITGILENLESRTRLPFIHPVTEPEPRQPKIIEVPPNTGDRIIGANPHP